jgi:hypothetical protein
MCEIVCDANWQCSIQCTDYQARSSGIGKFVIGRWGVTIKEHSVRPPAGWEYRLVPNNPKHPEYGNELHLIPDETITSRFTETFCFETDEKEKEVEAFVWETREAISRALKERGHIKLLKQ